jgi:hypothetical protein
MAPDFLMSSHNMEQQTAAGVFVQRGAEVWRIAHLDVCDHWKRAAISRADTQLVTKALAVTSYRGGKFVASHVLFRLDPLNVHSVASWSSTER